MPQLRAKGHFTVAPTSDVGRNQQQPSPYYKFRRVGHRVSQWLLLAALAGESGTDQELTETLGVSLPASSVAYRTVFGVLFLQSARMRLESLTGKRLNSVACPTCGVPAGRRCLLYSGASRLEPHVSRMLVAVEAIERGQPKKLSSRDRS
jgi:hypothetical protein